MGSFLFSYSHFTLFSDCFKHALIYSFIQEDINEKEAKPRFLVMWWNNIDDSSSIGNTLPFKDGLMGQFHSTPQNYLKLSPGVG